MNTWFCFASYRLQKILLKRAGLWYHTGREMKGRVALCAKCDAMSAVRPTIMIPMISVRSAARSTSRPSPPPSTWTVSGNTSESTTIDANGAVIRVDGINERGHAGSFVHEELHEENRERKRMGLSKGTRRTAAAAPQPSVQRPASRQSGRQSGKAQPAVGKLIFWIFAAIIGLNILSSLVGLLLMW